MLNENGQKLFLNTIAYAVGSKAPPTVSIARSGANVIVTYAGGKLEATDALSGTWATVSDASPATVPAGGSAKFFRVRVN